MEMEEVQPGPPPGTTAAVLPDRSNDAAAGALSPHDTWDNFQDPPTLLYQPQFHPGRLLWERATTGTCGQRPGRPPLAYTLGFTPRDMRRLRFVTTPTCRPQPTARECVVSHQGCVNAACWSPDGRFLFTGSDDRLVKVWAADDGYKELLSINTGHGNNIFGAHLQPGAPHMLFTCAADGTIRSFNLEAFLLDRPRPTSVLLQPTAANARVVGAHRSIVHGFEFWMGGGASGGGDVATTLFAALDEGVVMRYDLRAPAREGEIAVNRRVLAGTRLSRGAVKALAIPDPNNCSKGISPYMLCVGGNGARLDVYDIRRMPVPVGDDRAPLLRFCPRSLPPDGLGMRQSIDNVETEDDVSVSGMVFSQRRAELLVSYQEDQIYAFRWGKGQGEGEEGGMVTEAWSLGGHLNSQTFLKTVRYFGPQDEYVVSGCDSGHSWVWDRRTGGLAVVVRTDSQIANGVIPHPSAPALACYGIDNEVRVLEVGTGKYFSAFAKAGTGPEACVDDDVLETPKTMPSKFPLFWENQYRCKNIIQEKLLLPCVGTGPCVDDRNKSQIPRGGVLDVGRYRRHVARVRRGMAEERMLVFPWREPGMEPETRRKLLLLPDFPIDVEDEQGQPAHLPGLFGKQEGASVSARGHGAGVVACMEELYAVLLCVKERGNAFFQAKRYDRAATCYARVNRWCEALGNWGKPLTEAWMKANDKEERLTPGEERRLLVLMEWWGGPEAARSDGDVAPEDDLEKLKAVGLRFTGFMRMVMDLMVTATLNEATCMLAKGHADKALPFLTWVVKARPQHAKGLFRRGTALMALGQHEEAVQDLTKAAELEEGDKLIQRKLAEARRAWQVQRERQARAYRAFFAGGGEEEEG